MHRPTVNRPALLYGLLFAVVAAWIAVTSVGFVEADGVTHYLYAREAFFHPWVFADVWGRPVVKLLHAPVAWVPGTVAGQPLGLVLVRFVSLGLAVAGALLAARVATHVEGHAGTTFVCCLASPLVVLHAAAELTELPFGTLTIGCLLAYATRRFVILALLAGMLPATRPEGIGFALLIVVTLALRGKWRFLPLVALFPTVWATAGWFFDGAHGNALTGPFLWIASAWPYSGESTYGSGPLLKFADVLPAAVGPMLVPFVLVGLVLLLRDARAFRDDHAARVALAAAGVPLVVFAVHSILHWTGRMASSGEVRYLLAVSPFWGIAAARGLAFFVSKVNLSAWSAVACAVVPMALLHAVNPVVPMRDSEDARATRRAAALLSPVPADFHVDHPIFHLAAGTSPFSGGSRDLVRDAPPGTLYLWHDVFSRFNADDRYVVPRDLPGAYGWRDVSPADLPEAFVLFQRP